ncbi:MAG: hypothetical protein R2731_16660 [Nocardioides sp.]
MRGTWLVRGGHRHPARPDLEVDGGGADADQRQAQLVTFDVAHALAVLAVAERAPRQEQLPALHDLLGVARGPFGRRRREGGVQAAGDEQPSSITTKPAIRPRRCRRYGSG